MLATFLRSLLIGVFFFRSSASLRAERACCVLHKQVWLKRGGNGHLVYLANVFIDAALVVLGYRGDKARRRGRA